MLTHFQKVRLGRLSLSGEGKGDVGAGSAIDESSVAFPQWRQKRAVSFISPPHWEQ